MEMLATWQWHGFFFLDYQQETPNTNRHVSGDAKTIIANQINQENRATILKLILYSISHSHPAL